jgi:uncharacterized repeat protein (TIGR02543 family)
MSRFLRFFRAFVVAIACAFSAFSAQAYTITLDDRGAVLPSAPTEFQSGSIPGLDYLPHKPGYGYAGHWTGPNCTGTQMITTDYYTVPGTTNVMHRGRIVGEFTQDQTLYACWRSVLELPTWQQNLANGWTAKAVLVFNENGGSRYNRAYNFILPHDSFGCTTAYLPTNGYPGAHSTGSVGVLVENGDWVILGKKNGTYKWLTLQRVSLGNSCTVYEETFSANSGVLNLTNYDFDGYNSNTSGTGFQVTEAPNSSGVRYLKNASTVMAGMSGAFGQGTFNTVYAKWRPEVYQVNLATGGSYGSGATPNPVYLRYGEGWYDTREHAEAGGDTGKITRLDRLPSNGDLVFMGYWTEENSGGQQIIYNGGQFISGTTDDITRDNTTLYPRWSNPTVWAELTFNDQNATTGSKYQTYDGHQYYLIDYPLYTEIRGNCTGNYKTSADCGAGNIYDIIIPTRTGWVYGGHYTGSQGGGGQVVCGTNQTGCTAGNLVDPITLIDNNVLTQDMTVYAKWHFPITYVAGTGASGSQTSGPTECIAGQGCYAPDIITFTPPSGKTFARWQCRVYRNNGSPVDCVEANVEPGQLLSGADAIVTNGISDVTGVELTAVWEETQSQYYQITLSNVLQYEDWNGGSDRGGSVTPIPIETNQYIYEVPVPNQNAGWYIRAWVERGWEYRRLDTSISIFESIADGGAGVDDPRNMAAGFLGYYDSQRRMVIDAGGFIQDEPGAVYNTNTTLSARFSGTERIYFDASGGEWGDCNQTYIAVTPGGTMPTLRCSPELQGYRFTGYYDVNGNQWYSSLYPVFSEVPELEDIPDMLWARWEPIGNKISYRCPIDGNNWQEKHTDIYFYRRSYVIWNGVDGNANGGMCPNTNASEQSAGSKLVGWNVKLVDDPGGETVRHFNVGQTVTWPWYNGGQFLYADYQPIYYVTLNHLGTGSNASVPLNNTPSPNNVYFWNGRFYTDNSATVLAQRMNVIPVKYGYTFDGYYLSSGGSWHQIIDVNGNFPGNPNDYIRDDNTTISARWTVKQYNVHLNPNFDAGATGTTDGTEEVSYNADEGWFIDNNGQHQQIPSITKPTWDGHVFGGYWTHSGGNTNSDNIMVVDANGTLLVNDQQLKQMFATGDIPDGGELYAYWTAQPTAPQGENEKFVVQTTQMPANTRFAFSMSAAGQFYVDWGDGTIDSINRVGNVTPAQYEHTYTSASANGGWTITIWGTATGYNSEFTTITFINGEGFSGTPLRVGGISGSLGAVFPTLDTTNVAGAITVPSFSNTFAGCSNLTTDISNLGTLFSWVDSNQEVHGVTGARVGMFETTFAATGITGVIPSALFSGVSGSAERMFNGTFEFCEHLTGVIPGNLFNGVSGSAGSMFKDTFEGDSGLTGIGTGLFSHVSGVAPYMFEGTFAECSGITSVPNGLFGGVSAVGNATGSANSMFNGTFAGTGITALPATLFGTITANGVTKENMMLSMFAGAPLNGANNYIPKTLFLDSNNQPRITDNTNGTLMTGIFAGTGLATSCDSFNLTRYTTDYDNTYWGGKVICAPAAVFSCENPNVVGSTGTPSPDVIWMDAIENLTALPAGSACTAEHYTPTNYWACTGNSNCTGNPNHWAAGGTKPSWLTSSVNQSVNFYMEYTPVEYHVALSANGGTAGPITTLYEMYNTNWSLTSGGSPITSLTSAQLPEWQGHTFSGYYDSPNEGEGNQMIAPPVSGQTVAQIVAPANVLTDSTKTWYAHWSAGPYDITFSCGDGGAWTSGFNNSSYVQQNNIQLGGNIQVPPVTFGSPAALVCTKAGYTFTQWEIVTNGALIPVANNGTTYVWNHYFGSNIVPDWAPIQTTITLDQTGATTNGTTTLYAVYDSGAYLDQDREFLMTPQQNPINPPVKRATVSFDNNHNNGGGNVAYTVTLPFNGYYDAQTDGTKTIYGVGDNANYITTEGATAAAGYTNGYNDPQTWYVRWGATTLSAAGIDFPANPMRDDGYIFDGWWTEAEGGTRVDGSTSITGNVTWYAHWKWCGATLNSMTHVGSFAVSSSGNQCVYNITCDVCDGTSTRGCYTRFGNYGGSTDPYSFNIINTQTTGKLRESDNSFVECHARKYHIYYDMPANAIMPTYGLPDWYRYGTGESITGAPSWENGNAFLGWCTDAELSSCVETPDQQTGAYYTISSTEYGTKTYYAKTGCAPGYEKYNWVNSEGGVPYNFTVQEFSGNGQISTNTYSANSCVPGQYIVSCDANCGNDTCVACIEQIWTHGNTSYPIHGDVYLGQRYGVYSWTHSIGIIPDVTTHGGLVAVLNGLDSLDACQPSSSPWCSAVAPFGQTHGQISLYGTSQNDDFERPLNTIFDQNSYVAYINALAQSRGVTPWRQHYTFDGLWTQAEGGQRYLPVNENGLTPWSGTNAQTEALTKFFTHDATVYAHWIPDVYNVKLMRNYDSDDNTQVGNIYEEYGNGWATTSSGPFNQNLVLSGGSLPTRTGYTFAGYWTNNACDGTGTKIINADGSLNTSASSSTGTVGNAKYFGENATLYACWTGNEYYVTLKPNLGTGAHGTSSDTKIYTKYATGVYTNSARTEQYRMTTSANPVARPERYFTITYNPNYTGGETWTSNVQSVFKGYFSSASSSTKYINGDNDTAPKPGYITPGGDSAAQGYTVNTKKWYAQWTNGEHDLHLATRDGYVFKGWYNDAQLTNFFNDWTVTITPTADKTLYAKWAQCNWNAGANSTAAIQPMDNQNHPNRCKYRVTCTAEYTHGGDSQFDYYGDAGVESGTLPGCGATEYTITYYDNPAYETTSGQHITLSTQSYSYDPNNTVTLWTPDADILATHNASSVTWCADLSDETTCANQLPAGTTGNVTLYAKWTCETGYRTYAYDTWTIDYYGSSSGHFAAGMCAPARYVLNCYKNCPTGETCNACLEDFQLLSGDSAHYKFGNVYNAVAINSTSCVVGSGGDWVPEPVKQVSLNPGGIYLFTMTPDPNYQTAACWFNSNDVSDSVKTAYSGGNYKTFMEAVANQTYNSALSFGATHYEFDGLWTAAQGGDPYVRADGLSWTGHDAFRTQEMMNRFTTDTNLYAHWTPKEYTINLNTNGGTYGNTGERFIKEKWGETWRRGNGALQWFDAADFTIGQTSGYNDGRPTRDGYTFMGYYTEQQTGTSCPGTKIINADGTLNREVNGISSATYFDNENGSTLYACWQGVTYHISFELNNGTTRDAVSAQYAGDPTHIDNPAPVNNDGVHHQVAFKGWTITRMQGNTAHEYGATNSLGNSTNADSLDLSNTDIQWFKNLRMNDEESVLFTAKWQCENDTDYNPADCTDAGAHVVTIKAGYGVSGVSAAGWTANADGTEITRTFDTGAQITLSGISLTRKVGYNGVAYRFNGDYGQLDNGVFTVGQGAATIYLDAGGVDTPQVTISGGATKVYNYQATTLTGTVTNDYDTESISFTYQFTRADTENGAYTNVGTNRTYSVSQSAYHGKKYFKVKVTASGEGSLVSSVGTSSATFVELLNAPITFDPNGGALVDAATSPRYVPYNKNGNLYSGEYSEIIAGNVATLPVATRTGYDFAGWWTTPGNDGWQVYVYKEGTQTWELTTTSVPGYVFRSQWRITSTDGKSLYAHWEPKIYEITLNKNGGIKGPDEFYEKYDEGYALSREPDNWNIDIIMVPIKQGYTFAGYYDNEQFTGDPVIGTDGKLPRVGGVLNTTFFTADTQLYAKWTAKQYHIQYNLNNDSTWTNTDVAYDSIVTVNNPTAQNSGNYHQTSFAGWNVTNMQSGVVHSYGESESSMTETGDNVTDWTYETITPSIVKFENLRADTGTVTFSAVWNCVEGWLPPTCAQAGAHTITIKAGYGIGTVSGNNWTPTPGTNSTEITRTYNTTDSVDLSTITADLKGGYTGRAYRVTTSGGGSINGSMFTVGSGDAVIYIDATGVVQPVAVLSVSATDQIYNYQPVTLTVTDSNGTAYDSSITVTYQFAGPKTSTSGTWTYVESDNPKTIGKAEFLGTRYYRAKIIVSANAENGGFTKTSAASSTKSVTLNKKQLTFNPHGGTLGDSSNRYIMYDSDKLYSGATSATEIAVPVVTAPTGYVFDGWYTDYGTNGTDGEQVYDANGILASYQITDWIDDGLWKSTGEKTLHAHWTRGKYNVTLIKNHDANDNTQVGTLYEEYGTGWSNSANGDFVENYELPAALIPSKAGHTFAGYWNARENGDEMVIKVGNVWKVTASPTTLTTNGGMWYAHWDKNRYNVTYDCGGHGTGSTDSTPEYGSSYTPKTLAQANCNENVTGQYFGGWTVSNSDDIRPAGTSFTWEYTENKVFTARWIDRTYHVTLNPNGGTGGTGEVWMYYNHEWRDGPSGNRITTITLPQNAGKTFTGYYMQQQDGGTPLITSATLPNANLDLGNSNEVTLYAHWATDTYTITYLDSDGSSFPAGFGMSPTSYTYSSTNAVQLWNPSSAIKAAHHATGVTWCLNTNGTNCMNSIPAEGTGNKIFYAKWTPCADGYHQSGLSCIANVITIDWDENNNNGTEVANGMCTYGGNLDLASAPVYTNYEFNGWKLYDNSYRGAGDTVANGCVQTYIGVTSGTSNAIQAQWCRACAPGTNAHCSRTNTTPGSQCTYSTLCDEGYHIVSGNNAYNPVCAENTYTITYSVNGGTGSIANQSVQYLDSFTTDDATGISKANSIVKYWTVISGGNYTEVGKYYDHYDVTSDTALQANWVACTCTHGADVSSCETSASNNQCQAVVTCAPGYDQASASSSCIDEICSASCGAGRYEITLNQNGATTEKLYTIYGNDSDAGVYTNSARTSEYKMTTTTHPVPSLPSRQWTVSYNRKNGTWVSALTNSNTKANATFNGYYSTASSTTQYVGADGLIETAGINAGKGYQNNNAQWYAQWTNGTVALPNVYRAGYVFAGWSETSTGETSVGGAGDTYTPLQDNKTLYAIWTKCPAGSYCPGTEVVDNSTVYNQVHTCPTLYPNSVAGSSSINDCYLNLTAGKYVPTMSGGAQTCPANNYCDVTGKVYYAGSGTGHTTTVDAKLCSANAGSFAYSAVGTDNIVDCYKIIELNKRDGSGDIRNYDGTMASGTNSAQNKCFYETVCSFPSAAGLVKTGYQYYHGWSTQDEDCNNNDNPFGDIVSDSVGVYYACRMPNGSTVSLRRNLVNGPSDDTLLDTVSPIFDAQMPQVNNQGNNLTVPTYASTSTTTYRFKGYFDARSGGNNYYDASMSGTRPWDKDETSVDLYVHWGITCAAGYYLPASSIVCAACPAGEYCTGNQEFEYSYGTGAVDQGRTGYIAAGYYSTGGASTATPATCGTNHNQACLVAGGYYSTGAGTSATPTATGNGCLSEKTCGKVHKNNYSTGGGKAYQPSSSDCVSGQHCGLCPRNYRADTYEGKADITECFARCNAGQRVVTAAASSPYSIADAAGCTTPIGNDWWSNAHNVYYRNASPVVTNPNSVGVHACATDYNTPDTTNAKDHNERKDCERTVSLNKNGGSGQFATVAVNGVIYDDGGTSDATAACQEGMQCNFGDPATVLTQTGYAFTANTWGTNAACANPLLSPFTTILENDEYYACKTANTVNITYDCGLATGNGTTDTVAFDGSHTVKTLAQAGCATSLTGYTFDGWRMTPANVDKDPGDVISPWNYTADQTFTAQWTPNTYNITYDENGGMRGLPNGYTMLEYVESNGSQYVVTNFTPSADFKHTIVFMGLSGNSSKYIAGTNSGAAGRAGNVQIGGNYISGIYGNDNSDSYVGLVDTTTNGTGGISVLNSKTTLILDLHNNNANSILLNGRQVANSTHARITSTSPMKLFGMSSTSGSKIRLYLDTIEQDGVVIHNYVPAKNSSNVVGLYDTVTKTFLVPIAGTLGEGPVVSMNTDAYPASYTYGVGATVYGVPMRDHSIFEGWCQSESPFANCTMPHEITTTEHADVPLYAKWSCETGYTDSGNACVANTYDVTYNCGLAGGEHTYSNSATYDADYTVKTLAQAECPTTLAGYTFNGWHVTPANEDKDAGTTFTWRYTANQTFTAQWVQNCNQITLNANGGTTGSVTRLYKKTNDTTWYKNSTCTQVYETNTSLRPTRSNDNGVSYTFRGFYSADLDDVDANAAANAGGNSTTGTQYIKSNATTTVAGNAWTINGATTLYAAWARNCNSINPGSCTLTVSTDDSTTPSQSGAVTYGLTCPTPGYTGVGAGTYNPSCNPNDITVILNKNGGTGTCGGVSGTANGQISCVYNGACNTPAWNTTTCNIGNGTNIFTGWNTASDGTGTSYGTATTAGDIQNINTGGTTTLYAQWAPASCVVTNGTATISVTNNTPSCDVTCNTGYVTSGTYTGTQHATTVTTGQCSAGTYDITYDWNGGTEYSSALSGTGYDQVEYISNAASTYVDTGIIPDVDDIEMNIRFYNNTTSSNYLFQSRATSSGTLYGITGSSSGSTINAVWAGSSVRSDITRTTGHVYTMNAKFVNGIATLYVLDETTGQSATNTGTYTFAIPATPFGIFGNYGGNTIVSGQRVYSAWMKVGGQYVMNYVPASNNGTAGFYDIVSQELKGATAGSLIAGPDVTIPYPQNYTYGVGATVYGVPVRDHSVFEGWCRTDFPSLTDCAMPHEITTTEHADVTLYAKWSCESGYTLNSTTGECEANRITINYVKGAHGIGSVPQNSSCYYGQTVRLRPGMFESGYVFGGWKMLTNNRVFAPETEIACDYETLGAYSGTITAEGQWDVQQYTVVYDCGYKLDGTTHVSGTAPANNTVYTGQAFYAPNNAGACSYPGFNFVGWRPEGESANWVNGTSWNLTPVPPTITFVAQWEFDPVFTVTINIPSTETFPVNFKFNLAAAGDFVVDWGDNSSVSEISRANATAADVTHSYAATGTYVIRMGGQAISYNSTASVSAIRFFNGTVNNDQDVTATGTEKYITRIDGALGKIFSTIGAGNSNSTQPRFYRTFLNAFNMSQPMEELVGLFKGIEGAPRSYMFMSTFDGCSGLSGAVPSGLFGVNGAPQENLFRYTFRGCTGLTGAIPNGLFAGIVGAPAQNMFSGTFKGCSGLVGEISTALFKGVEGTPASYMFAETFYGCSGLTGNIPETLFARISGAPAESMFANTFNGCSGLTGIGGAVFKGINGTPQPNMFAGTFEGCSGLIGTIPSELFGTPNGAAAEGMFNGTFSGCSGLTGTIPSGLFGTLSGAGKTNMFANTFYGDVGLTGYVPKGLFGTMTVPSSVPTGMMSNIFVNTGLVTECPCGTIEVASDFKPYWNSTASQSSDKKVSCEVGLKPGEHWYNGTCTTACPVVAMDELHVGNIIPYVVFSEPLTSPSIHIKYGDTTCYVPLERENGLSGGGGTSGSTDGHELKIKYLGKTYKGGRPDDIVPEWFSRINNGDVKTVGSRT